MSDGEISINGIILKCVGGRYTVLADSGERLACRARGAFRHENVTPVAGDRVIVTCGDVSGDNRRDEDMYAIDSIAGRSNLLIRPPLANLGVLFIVMASAEPEPYLPLTDKLTVICARQKIKPVVVVTKSSLDGARAEEIAEIYRHSGFDAFITDALSGDGIGELKRFFTDPNGASGVISAFCGVSGAGKSTLINALFPALSLASGELSQRIRRGRNTTRQTELFPLAPCDGGGYLADTPGFSLLDFTQFFFCTLDELPTLFPDFTPYLPDCRYTSCSHTKEADCGVNLAIARGEVEKSRHDSFLLIREELKKRPAWEDKNLSK